MPGVNHVMLASGAVVAVSVALAAAIAVYESPEVRRYADDVRRRIAMALHSIGDEITPPHREPIFNRPEDSDGFLQSRRGAGAEPGVDADDETRRRQREELLYWNSIRMQELEKKPDVQPRQLENRPRPAHRGSSFDDFLRPDSDAEQGAYVFNTGADVRDDQDGLRRRGDGARGFSSSLYANPFADEHLVMADELEDVAAKQISPDKDEEMSDIYSAMSDDRGPVVQEPTPVLIDLSSTSSAPVPVPDIASSSATASVHTAPTAPTESSATLDKELLDNEFITAGQEDREEAYASIQAWAQNSNPDFYSPLPLTPVASVSAASESEAFSDGELTPTDSMSVVDPREELVNDTLSSHRGDTGRVYDVMSESEGIATPGSWSEVGSVISESDTPLRA
ncbi:hypothetical protein S40293_07958 [Stachybotrys chartarum IBT 40293]|nr:hypothetical protein S40293_07958 [Stachybotrys chartarum IBT 40293]